eukprot:CAMPEP_0197646744 /NCGR_PEP_ID=MMETSP1338-20131121/23826_1 /TAXON_ID=43686 ORGANISM="Pelagodinium beii, Strain RCC1491" /NCGR_SAMPLE_ID=MMETSP1338 /ASSEMBLY_ACC=CAM_ASM_000754 /LENGTH=99 /DNA_ID=CAMNT_0043220405 /DNA_START=60 /DNA_END=359 /DNA_ORIENTATION=-
MALNVLFGSRLLPKAVARPVARSLPLVVSSRLASSVPEVAASTLALGAPAASAPRVGSRIWYRIPGWDGPGGWVLWLTGWTSCACFVQEIAGPYIFFHE